MGCLNVGSMHRANMTSPLSSDTALSEFCGLKHQDAKGPVTDVSSQIDPLTDD